MTFRTMTNRAISVNINIRVVYAILAAVGSLRLRLAFCGDFCVFLRDRFEGFASLGVDLFFAMGCPRLWFIDFSLLY